MRKRRAVGLPSKDRIIMALLVLLTACSSPLLPDRAATDMNRQTHSDTESELKVQHAISKMDPHIRSVFQDKSGNFWFGTNGNGVYRYDGKVLSQFTIHDGLASNQVQQIQEDARGNMWFVSGAFEASKWKNEIFTIFTENEHKFIQMGTARDWKLELNDVWFCAGGGVYRNDGQTFYYLPLELSDHHSTPKKYSPFELNSWSAYSVLKDSRGVLWIGTQAEGVCRYDGKTFTWLKEKGLSGSAVLALLEDGEGNMWFGNNGAGLFKYDGASLINLTDERGLGNSAFKYSGQPGPNTLARIYSICEDNAANLWIGTVDAGVWKLEKDNLTQYTMADGLSSNAVNMIYNDRNGNLWFSTDANGICRFNGTSFSVFDGKLH